MVSEQLGLEGMPTRLFSCTPTRLNTWLDCPRRYRMQYIDRPTPPKGPPWAHNALGAAVHNALRAWWDVPLARRTPQAAGALVESGWISDGFKDDAQSSSWRARARAMVERYTEQLDPAAEPRAVERTVAVKTDRLAVSGRVDRIDARPAVAAAGAAEDELVVVDYKTGRRPSTVDDARGSLALAIYVLATRRTLRAASHRVELHHVPSGEIVGWDHTEESLARHLRRAESIAAEAGAAEAAYKVGECVQAGWEPTDARASAEVDALFPARTGVLCGWCDFARHCPEGRAAAPAKLPWAAVSEEG